MKIYKKIIFDWDGLVLEEDFFEYQGPLVKCGGGPSIPDTQTTISEPWAEQKPHLIDIYAGAKDFFDEGGAELFPDSFTAARDPNTLQGEQNIIDYLKQGQFADTGQAAAGATIDMFKNPYGSFDYAGLASSDPGQFGMTSPEQNEALSQQMSGDPFRNPFTNQVIDAFSQDMRETYNRDIAPQARTAQIAYQPGGSSRGDIINARNIDDLNENIGNFASQMYQQDYRDAINNQARGIDLYTQRAGLGEAGRQARAGEGLQRYGAAAQGYGSVLDTITQGYGTQAAIGEDIRAFDQQGIDEAAFRFDYGENKDFYNLKDYQSFFSPGFGGTQSTSFNAGPSDLQAALTGGGGLLSILMGMS